MDKIIIKDLQVYGYHGVNKEEKEMGQRFLISLELNLDLRIAGKSDNLNQTVNYAELCEKVEEKFKERKFDLIERAAEYLAEFILNNYEKVENVKIGIKKPWAPIGKPLDYAGIEIERGWHIAFIGLGSNLGDKKKNMESAIEKLNSLENTIVTKVSDTYETKPVGYTEQDNFYNCVAEIKTQSTPRELMEALLSIEDELKRERVIKWGPRTIDLDVILYDDLVTYDKDIIIPHPRMHERLFVLKPLSDIAPFVVHPLLKRRISELAEELWKTQEL